MKIIIQSLQLHPGGHFFPAIISLGYLYNFNISIASNDGMNPWIVLKSFKTLPNFPPQIWRCKLVIVAQNYFLMANYFWIFAEGLYMHQLIFFSVMVERRGVAKYALLGWRK